MAKASDNLFPKLLVVETAAPAAPAAGSQGLFIDPVDHKLKRVNASGTITTIEGGGGGSGQGLVDFARAKRTSGDIAISSTTFVNVDTGLDLVMSASVGDVIECAIQAQVVKSAAGNTYAVFDFVTVVSGAAVNSLTAEAAAGTGLTSSFAGWGVGEVGPANSYPGPQRLMGTKRYTLQAGDISSGTVTLRLRGFVGAACALRAADPMLYVQATNLGQQL